MEVSEKEGAMFYPVNRIKEEIAEIEGLVVGDGMLRDAIHRKGISELQGAVTEHLLELKLMAAGVLHQLFTDDLKAELDAVSVLSPMEDISMPNSQCADFCFKRNKDLYQRYFTEELASISRKTGTSFS